jgi:hypothetical protein
LGFNKVYYVDKFKKKAFKGHAISVGEVNTVNINLVGVIKVNI